MKNQSSNKLNNVIKFCKEHKFKNIFDYNSIPFIEIPYYKNGSGIKIKKKNKGKFTDYCGGKVTPECIARGKKSTSPIIRKRATFADNARKFKHLFGGLINFLHLLYINNFK